MDLFENIGCSYCGKSLAAEESVAIENGSNGTYCTPSDMNNCVLLKTMETGKMMRVDILTLDVMKERCKNAVVTSGQPV